MTAHILINEGGGTAGEKPAVAAALRDAGVDGEPRWLDGGEIAQAAEKAVADGAKLVVAGGGDGTVSAVASALAGTDTPLGVLPLGTLNHFARDLGLPLDLASAAKVIGSGRARSVDVGEVNGRVFVNNSAIGVYPLMVVDRESQQRRLGRRKRLAMGVAAARTLLRFSSRRLTLTVNGKTVRVETPLMMVGNNCYRLEMPGAGSRERLDAAELCLVLLRRNTRWGFFAASVRALIGRDRSADVVRLDDVRELLVDSEHSHLTISIDGETERVETPITYRIRPKALKVIAP